MKRLLLVTYYYPPLGGPGVFRPLRLSKYLPRHGWAVTVLTVSARVRLLKDPSLEQDVPPGTRIVRAPALEPRTPMLALNKLGLRGLVRRLQPWWMVPDEQRGWVWGARRHGLGLLREARHDAMITTAAPYSAHLVGRALHAATGIPWVADFRDEWTTNPYLRDRYPTRWHAAHSRRLERAVLAEASRVVCVSRPWLDNLRAVAGENDGPRFRVLPNGYDGEHFPERPVRRPDRFRIVYTGMFYGHRSPNTFLEAVRVALATGRIPAEELEVVLMGHTGAGDVPWSGTDLGARVRVVEQRPYREALALLDEAAALLLVVPRAGGAGNHTGKLFPYLASGRPILALAPRPNVAADLVRDSRSGVVADPDDVQAAVEALTTLYGWWRGPAAPVQDRAIVTAYEADRQAAEWAAMLGEIAS